MENKKNVVVTSDDEGDINSEANESKSIADTDDTNTTGDIND